MSHIARHVLIADHIRLDASNKEVIVGAYCGMIVATKMPVAMRELSFRIEIESTPTKMAELAVFRCVAPSGLILASHEWQIAAERTGRWMFTVRVLDVQFNEQGSYRIDVEIGRRTFYDTFEVRPSPAQEGKRSSNGSGIKLVTSPPSTAIN